MSKVAHLLLLIFLFVPQFHFTSAAEENAAAQGNNCDGLQQQEQTRQAPEDPNAQHESKEEHTDDKETTTQHTETTQQDDQKPTDMGILEETQTSHTTDQAAENRQQDDPQPQNNTENRSATNIVINEFVSDPSTGELEWVELFNISSDLLSLENLFLEEGSKRKTLLHGNIAPNGFFIIEKINGNLNNAGDSISLNESESVILNAVSYGNFDDGNTSDNAPAADDPFSVARMVDGQNTNVNLLDFAVTTKPTKGAPNIIVPLTDPTEPPSVPIDLPNQTQDTPSQSEPVKTSPLEPQPQTNQDAPATETAQQTSVPEMNTESTPRSEEVALKIIISEILPNPIGNDDGEWIELYNAGENLIDLSGWILDDGEGGSKPYIIETLVIAPNNFAVLARSQTKLILNNEGDTVRLFSPDGTLKESVSYDTAEDGLSYARFDDTWKWTASQSPGGTNIQPTDTDQSNLLQAAFAGKGGTQQDQQETHGNTPINVPIKDISSLQLGTFVAITGIVLVEPQILGTQIMYVGDDESGIQIYSYKKQWPVLVLGDNVSIIGVISQTRNERKVNIKQSDDIQVLSHGTPPLPISLEDPLEESMTGRLMQTTGQVVTKRGSTLVIDNGIEPFEIYLKKSTGIDASLIEINTKIAVVGIIQRQNETYKILPRYKKDIEATAISTSAVQPQRVLSLEPTSSNSRKFFILAGILSPLLLGLVYTLFKGRNQTTT